MNRHNGGKEDYLKDFGGQQIDEAACRPVVTRDVGVCDGMLSWWGRPVGFYQAGALMCLSIRIINLRLGLEFGGTCMVDLFQGGLGEVPLLLRNHRIHVYLIYGITREQVVSISPSPLYTILIQEKKNQTGADLEFGNIVARNLYARLSRKGGCYPHTFTIFNSSTTVSNAASQCHPFVVYSRSLSAVRPLGRMLARVQDYVCPCAREPSLTVNGSTDGAPCRCTS